ncbi:hypothetical protein [Microbispora sp. GKU 823]|uniref:hypothetical protein n=1 Tax=Microbispora sp. GKU 823 TaxID=1652100 RepID=UPI0009A3E2D6|nr:hypothetical protein [Microbispora sp. GKU 823]OPG06236.1 hypothetical protein B1L11_33425 [Microbispora sp. GKU 823]
MRKTISAAAAGLAVLAASLAAPAAAFANDSAATKPLHLRKGLTLTIPSSWKVDDSRKDWVRVITGSCPTKGTDTYGFRDSGCHSFWVMGPGAIKIGHELFQKYTPDGPFYPATDVGPCPVKKNLYMGQSKLAAKGLRQVGPGHKAYYRDWAGTCVTMSSYKVKAHYNQREWYLPTSKILVIDQWGTPGLSTILKNATWS